MSIRTKRDRLAIDKGAFHGQAPDALGSLWFVARRRQLCGDFSHQGY